MGPVLYGVLLLAFLALAVGVTYWIWRDMAARDRPPWLRSAVIVALVIFVPVGLVVWMIDLSRHPHDAALSRPDVALQRYGDR
jgi:Flp pilus assembly protein protease CpaA